jgi:Uma2 family endonuclease
MSMAKVMSPPEPAGTVADLLAQLGDIPANRVRLHPPPGLATEKDLITLEKKTGKVLCELVDGVLVEKAMGAREALLAGWLLHLLWDFLEQHDLGQTLGADGTLRLIPGLVRIPDVSFISWDQLPDRQLPDDPIPDLFPDLAVEVLSEGNTKTEMERKVREYFDAGARLVWLVDPKKRIVDVYTTPTEQRRLTRNQKLDGGEVLPGFTLSLSKLFAVLGKVRTNR